MYGLIYLPPVDFAFFSSSAAINTLQNFRAYDKTQVNIYWLQIGRFFIWKK